MIDSTLLGVILTALLGWGGWVTYTVVTLKNQVTNLVTKVELLESEGRVKDLIQETFSQIEKIAGKQ